MILQLVQDHSEFYRTMKKKLKVAMYMSSDPKSAGGIQTHVAELSENLNAKKHLVHLFYPNHDIGRILHFSLPNDIQGKLVIPKNNHHLPLSRMIDEGGYDLLHIHEPYVPFLAFELLADVRIPIITTFHSAWSNNKAPYLLKAAFPYLRRSFSDHIDGAIYVSEFVKKKWQEVLNKSIVQKVIHHGVNSDFYPLDKITNKKNITLLFMARLVSQKGLKYLLDALKLIIYQYPLLKLIIVGDGPDRKSMETYVKKNRLTNHVEFKGEILGKQRIAFFQAADIFCAPYLGEGFGISILEAMACACPVVGFRNSGFEMLANYPYPNLLVKQKDTQAFAQALCFCLENPNHVEFVKKWCAQNSKKFNWEKTASATEQLYYEMLKKRRCIIDSK